MTTAGLIGILGAAVLATMPISSMAQAYPDRPITVVVPYTPGGSVDTVARVVTAQLQKELGQPIIIENKPGASGMIGSEHVARANPDGYTLLLHASSQIYLPLVDTHAKYDALKDFTPIARIGTVPLLVVTKPDSPFNSLKELRDYAQKSGEHLTWATSGYGTSSHLTVLAMDFPLQCPEKRAAGDGGDHERDRAQQKHQAYLDGRNPAPGHQSRISRT